MILYSLIKIAFIHQEGAVITGQSGVGISETGVSKNRKGLQERFTGQVTLAQGMIGLSLATEREPLKGQIAVSISEPYAIVIGLYSTIISFRLHIELTELIAACAAEERVFAIFLHIVPAADDVPESDIYIAQRPVECTYQQARQRHTIFIMDTLKYPMSLG